MLKRCPPALLLAAILFLAACSEPPPPAPAPRLVRVVRVEPSAVSATLTFPGEVRARHESRLAFRVGGKLLERRVEVGDRVRRGQVLARLDAGDLILQAAQAEAVQALAAAEAARYRELRARNFVSQAALEAKETARATAAAQAALARNQAAYATLKAERDGVVTAVEAEPGQVLAAGQTVLRLAEDGEREIAIAVPEAEVETLRAAAGFTVSLNSLPGRSWVGRLRELAPAADPATRTYAARIAVPAADEAMRLGMSARVAVTVGRGDPAPVLPLSAFFTRDGTAHVWVVDPATLTVTLTKVDTDGIAGNALRVKAGLAPGQLVVVAGASLLEEGQKVRLAEPAP